MGFTLVALTLVFIVRTLFYRYPWNGEVAMRYAMPEHTSVVVDDAQSDIGCFGVTLVGPSGREEFFVETLQQWVFPWERYEWSATGE